MKWILTAFTSLAALWTLAACASSTDAATEQAAAGARDCFNSNAVSGYSVIDDHNIRVTAGASRAYILSTTWNARDLDWTHAIGIRSSTGWICTGNGLGVDLIGGEPQRTYPVTGIARAPEEPVQGS